MVAVLAKFLGRILIYLLGLAVVVMLVGMAAFVIARPQIDEFVTTEIKKRGLEVESWDLGFNGRANLRAARMTLPGGIEAKAALISGRPPVAGFSGSATLYDLQLERGNISLTIPKLDIDDVEQHEKDASISDRMLQTLNQFNIGQLWAEKMVLKIRDSDTEALRLYGLMLENLRQGKVGHLRFDTLDGQFTRAGQQTQQQADEGHLRLTALDLRDIDIAAALSWLAGRHTGRQGADESAGMAIMGPAHLDDLALSGTMAGRPVSVKLNSFSSQAVSLKPSDSDIVPLDVLRSLVVARGEAAPTQEQNQAWEKLLQLLGNFNTIDVRLGDMELDTPLAKINLQSADLQSTDWHSLIPEQINFRLTGLAVEITNPPQEIADILATTGYDRIEASMAIQARWDKDRQFLTLEDFSLDARNIGDFSLKFQIDNIDTLPLNATRAEREAWLQKLRLHDFDMGIRDRGAVANLAAIIAKIAGVEASEIQEGFEDMARGAPPILFEDETIAASARQAMLAFLQQSGLLRLHVSSKTIEGIEFGQIMGEAVDWPSLLAMAEIHFTHEEASPSSQ